MTWWRRLWHRRRLDEQLERELRFHLDEHAAALVSRGVPAEEARRQARLDLGGPEQVREQCLDARGTRWLDDAIQDVRYALRAIRQRPGFAAVAICTLALGVGATTVMFTVVNGVLLKPLAFPRPEQLLELHEQTNWSTAYGNQWAFAYPNYVDCARASRTLTLAAWRWSGGTLSAPGEPEYIDAQQVSANLFSVLGVALHRGRAFREAEDRPGGTPVAIVSYGLWQRQFAGSDAAVGARLVFEGKAYTVVGIAPPGFRLRDEAADLFTPMGQNPEALLANRGAHPGIQVWARLRSGASLTTARAELALVGRHLADQYPKSNAGRTFVAEPLRPDVGDVGSTLWLLLGAVGLVLLIACANVASLLLARAVSRDREFALRVALGAGRGRLVRQCLTESAVLGLLGGGLGSLVPLWGVQPFLAFWPNGLPRADEVFVDWRVLAFALAVSVASGVLFGLAPALRAPARDLEMALRAGGRSIRGSTRRLHGALVVCEIALAVVLLVCAGVLGRTLLRLSVLDPGVRVRNVLVARMALSPATLEQPGRTRAAWRDALERARRVPGVQAAAIVDTVPMRAGNNQLDYWTSAALPPADARPLALATCVTPDYFNVMGISLRAGRFFDAHDRMDAPPAIVIDDVLARSAFGGSPAVGRRLWIPQLGDGSFEVVGVVGHVRHWGLASDAQARVRAQLYYPFGQLPDRFVRRWSELMSIAVRTAVPPLSILEPLRRELRGDAGDQVLYEVRTLEQLARATLGRQRFLFLLFGIFATLAVLLACIGVYGVTAYSTSQRVPEIGVRLALGATAGDVIRLVLTEGAGMIAAGVGIGTLGGIGAGRLLQHLVDGVRRLEPSTIGLVVAMLAAAAFVATWIPARRAGRIDPTAALRQD